MNSLKENGIKVRAVSLKILRLDIDNNEFVAVADGEGISIETCSHYNNEIINIIEDRLLELGKR